MPQPLVLDVKQDAVCWPCKLSFEHVGFAVAPFGPVVTHREREFQQPAQIGRKQETVPALGSR